MPYDARRLDDFYGRHLATLAEALAPACEVLAGCGLDVRADSLAAAIVAESREMLAAGQDPAADPEARKEQWTARILAGELNEGKCHA